MDELRARLRRAEDDARAARFLASGADRDTAELRAELREFRTEFREYRTHNNGLLNAMREDFVDLRSRVDDGFARIGAEFAQIDRNFVAVNSKIDGLAAGLQLITDLLSRADDEPGG